MTPFMCEPAWYRKWLGPTGTARKRSFNALR